MDPARDDTGYTWRDYLAWPGDERFELVDGVAYAMSPAPRRRHQEVSGELFHQMYGALRDGPCHVFNAPFDVKLSSDEDDDAPTVVQPDVTVTCDSGKLTEQGMTGPPDLVVEVVSPESGLADRRRKFEVYQRFGVPEYWIVDHDEQVVEVYVLTAVGEYRRAGVYGPGERVEATAVEDVSIDLKEVFEEKST